MVANLRASTQHSPTAGIGWSTPQEIAQGDAFFANWADLPAAIEGPGGTRWAHWLEKLGAGTYVYGVQLARSSDGENWSPHGLLHEIATARRFATSPSSVPWTTAGASQIQVGVVPLE